MVLKTDGEIVRAKISLFNCSERLPKKVNVLKIDDADDDDVG